MGTPLADAREAARLAREQAAEQRKRSYRRARLGFKLLCAPVISGVAYVIYSCGYYAGLMDGLARIAK